VRGRPAGRHADATGLAVRTQPGSPCGCNRARLPENVPHRLRATYEIKAMQETLAPLITLAGIGQLCVLIASALVPFRLNWTTELAGLSRLHRQMYWVYGGYVVLAIVAFGLISLFNARELAAGSGLARAVCGYIAVFWGVRLSLQGVFDVKEHLTTWWLKAGYHTLTVLFVSFTLLYGYAALRPAG
jgi:hypothetical protein